MQPKQKLFADYYIETGIASESYKRAYPSCKKDATARTNGHVLLAREDVNSYIELAMESKDDERIASADEVLSFLTSQMRSDNVVDKDRIKCAELLGKRHRLFIDRVEADVTQKVYFEGEDEIE